MATTVSIDTTTIAALDARKKDETRSTRLYNDLAAYYALLDVGLRRARRVLTPAEGRLLLDVFNGTAPGQVWTTDLIVHRIDDAIVLDGVADKYGVDGKALLDKLRSLGDLSAIALADLAERYWAGWDPNENFEGITITFKG